MTARDRDFPPGLLLGLGIGALVCACVFVTERQRCDPPAEPPTWDPHFTVLDGTDEQSCITDHR